MGRFLDPEISKMVDRSFMLPAPVSTCMQVWIQKLSHTCSMLRRRKYCFVFLSHRILWPGDTQTDRDSHGVSPVPQMVKKLLPSTEVCRWEVQRIKLSGRVKSSAPFMVAYEIFPPLDLSNVNTFISWVDLQNNGIRSNNLKKYITFFKILYSWSSLIADWLKHDFFTYLKLPTL